MRNVAFFSNDLFISIDLYIYELYVNIHIADDK